ncbi:MAG: hypothetical protein M1608_10530, partial [Candidatus Omnitrophica bacterium]|nr:hypothetical protein [Candidatus Omnitrophota bacterium]
GAGVYKPGQRNGWVQLGPITNATTTFNTIWNTPDGVKPAGMAWGGKPDDLFIERIHLRHLFHRVWLNNLDYPLIPSAPFAVENHPASVTTNLELFVIAGTAMDFVGLDTNLQFRLTIDRDSSFFFERGYWHDRLIKGRLPSSLVQEYISLANEMVGFSNAPVNPSAGTDTNLVNQAVVVSAFNDFASNYITWANAGYPAAPADLYLTLSNSFLTLSNLCSATDDQGLIADK